VSSAGKTSKRQNSKGEFKFRHASFSYP